MEFKKGRKSGGMAEKVAGMGGKRARNGPFYPRKYVLILGRKRRLIQV